MLRKNQTPIVFYNEVSNVRQMDRRRNSRPVTSIFVRPSRRQYATKQTDIDFYVGLSEFGKDARKVAIGSSRRPAKPPPDTPGPGFYNTPAAPKDTRITHKMSNSLPHAEIRCPMTTNIDYIDERSFPTIKPRSIGVLDGSSFITHGEGSEPCQYTPPSELSKRSHKIENKYRPEKVENIPGPQKYSPQVVSNHSPAFALSGPKHRDQWLQDTRHNPSPNKYLPTRPEKTLPKYTIGYKSRKKKSKNLTPFPVDQFIVKLDDAITVAEARAYVISHPEIKDLVREIFDRIYEAKPSNPVEFLQDHFSDQKAQQQQNEITGNDDIDLNTIIRHLHEQSQWLMRANP